MMMGMLAEDNGVKVIASIENMMNEVLGKRLAEHRELLQMDVKQDMEQGMARLHSDLRQLRSELTKAELGRCGNSSASTSDKSNCHSSREGSTELVQYDIMPGLVMDKVVEDGASQRRPSRGTPRSASSADGIGNATPEDGYRNGSEASDENRNESKGRSQGQKKKQETYKKSATRALAFGGPGNSRQVSDSTSSMETVGSLGGLKGFLSRCLGHPVMDMVIGVLIFVNSIMLGFVVNTMADKQITVPPLGFRIAETIFCLFFSLEIAARLFVVGPKAFFLGREWQWNLFDFVIVGMQFIDEVAAVSGMNAMPQNLSFARVLKLLKMIRVVRVARVARVLRELRTLVASIVISVRSLLWTGILLLLMVYMVGLFLTQMVSEARIAGELDAQVEESLVYFYGSLPLSMLSLFMAITGGVDWDDLMRPLSDGISWGFAWLYVIYVGFSTMCLMNVVTGVFVDSVLVRAKLDREQFLVRNAGEIMSASGDGGALNLEQFLALVDTPPMQEFFKGIDANVTEAARLFSVVDVDESGLVDAEEFLTGCLRLHGPAKALDTAVLVQNVVNLGRDFKKLQETTKKFSSDGN